METACNPVVPVKPHKHEVGGDARGDWRAETLANAEKKESQRRLRLPRAADLIKSVKRNRDGLPIPGRRRFPDTRVAEILTILDVAGQGRLLASMSSSIIRPSTHMSFELPAVGWSVQFRRMQLDGPYEKTLASPVAEYDLDTL